MATITNDSNILKHFGGLSKNSLKEIFMNCDELENTIDLIAHSPYIETENIGNYLKDYTKDFCVLTLNIQSLNAKFDQLVMLIDILVLIFI